MYELSKYRWLHTQCERFVAFKQFMLSCPLQTKPEARRPTRAGISA